MKHIKTLIVITVIAIYSCGQHNASNKENEKSAALNNSSGTTIKQQFNLDTSVIAMLTVNNITPLLFNDVKPIELTNGDLSNVEQLLINCLNSYNAQQDTTKQFFTLIDLKKYKRQYVPFIDASGNRKVYVNCFCTSVSGFEDWRKNLVIVDDGGNCFFQLTVNLTNFSYEQFSTNGFA